MKEIQIKLPKKKVGGLWFNIAVTTDNHLIGDSNDSSRWETFKIPLPDGVWNINTRKSNVSYVCLTLDVKKYREKRLKDLLS